MPINVFLILSMIVYLYYMNSGNFLLWCNCKFLGTDWFNADWADRLNRLSQCWRLDSSKSTILLYCESSKFSWKFHILHRFPNMPISKSISRLKILGYLRNYFYNTETLIILYLTQLIFPDLAVYFLWIVLLTLSTIACFFSQLACFAVISKNHLSAPPNILIIDISQATSATLGKAIDRILFHKIAFDFGINYFITFWIKQSFPNEWWMS